MDLQLRDRRALVTGSSSGIGLAIAQAFLGEGARVAITGRRRDTLDAAAERLRAASGADRVLSVAGDLTQPSVAEQVAAAVGSQWGGLDVLVLNLGGGRSEPGIDVAPREWDRVLQLNLISAMDILRRAVPLLRSGRDPSVVFVGSIAGLEDTRAPVAYAAAKAALTQAMKSVSRLLAADGIRANMVAPGNIHFAGGTWDARVAADPSGVQRLIDAEVPLRRFGTPEEVAAVVLFLAGRPAAFVTGACIAVDGGQTRGT